LETAVPFLPRSSKSCKKPNVGCTRTKETSEFRSSNKRGNWLRQSTISLDSVSSFPINTLISLFFFFFPLLHHVSTLFITLCWIASLQHGVRISHIIYDTTTAWLWILFTTILYDIYTKDFSIEAYSTGNPRLLLSFGQDYILLLPGFVWLLHAATQARTCKFERTIPFAREDKV
jgi:hypothetical protein